MVMVMVIAVIVVMVVAIAFVTCVVLLYYIGTVSMTCRNDDLSLTPMFACAW